MQWSLHVHWHRTIVLQKVCVRVCVCVCVCSLRCSRWLTANYVRFRVCSRFFAHFFRVPKGTFYPNVGAKQPALCKWINKETNRSTHKHFDIIQFQRLIRAILFLLVLLNRFPNMWRFFFFFLILCNGQEMPQRELIWLPGKRLTEINCCWNRCSV